MACGGGRLSPDRRLLYTNSMRHRPRTALIIAVVCLTAALPSCRPEDGEQALRCLAYADTYDEAALVLRVEKAAYPILVEKLTAAQVRLRRELKERPLECLLAARRLAPGSPEAESAARLEAGRLAELEAALLLEAEELLVDPPEPRVVDDEYERDLALVVVLGPEQRLRMLLAGGIDESSAARLAEYDVERRTEGLSWHELSARFSSALAEVASRAAAYRRVNRRITVLLDEIKDYRRRLGGRPNPFAPETPEESG